MREGVSFYWSLGIGGIDKDFVSLTRVLQ
jgi:hypothetical protein